MAPALQTKSDATEVPEPSPTGEEPVPLSPPSKRIREKTMVKFLDLESGVEDDLDRIARLALLDEDYSSTAFSKILFELERQETPSGDRRGDFEGPYILGAFCHGGQRGVTALALRRPVVAKFLSSFLKSRLTGAGDKSKVWATVLVLRASDVAVHRDYRNEWGTENVIVHVPGQIQLWTGSPRDPKVPSAEIQPDWCSADVHCVRQSAVTFDPRNYHALRCLPGWLIVGFSSLGIHKIQEEDKERLTDLGFPLPEPSELHQVKMLRAVKASVLNRRRMLPGLATKHILRRMTCHPRPVMMGHPLRLVMFKMISNLIA